jgi:hypothetical protein
VVTLHQPFAFGVVPGWKAVMVGLHWPAQDPTTVLGRVLRGNAQKASNNGPDGNIEIACLSLTYSNLLMLGDNTSACGGEILVWHQSNVRFLA